MLACTAAPSATTSSGFKSVCGSRWKEIFHQSANFGNARGSADQHDFVNLFGLEAGVFQGLLAGADGAVDDRLNELLELLARDLAQIALAAGQLDVELHRWLRGERDLGFDHGFANGLHGFGVAAQVETQVAVNVVEGNGDQQIVDVVAAEMRVAVGGDDFKDAVVQFENRNVECAAAEVVDGDDAVLLFVEAVGERAAVGSLTRRRTSRPAMRPASFVAWRCASLK
jgi:hypothetical protein